MPDIDKFKPLRPIWPAKPGRKVEYDDPSLGDIEKQKKRKKQQDVDKPDDDSHHVDEYA